jgi:hypothetical protein
MVFDGTERRVFMKSITASFLSGRSDKCISVSWGFEKQLGIHRWKVNGEWMQESHAILIPH